MRWRKIVSVSLPEEDCKKLDSLARESYRTRAGYLRKLIKVYLQTVEQHPEQKI